MAAPTAATTTTPASLHSNFPKYPFLSPPPLKLQTTTTRFTILCHSTKSPPKPPPNLSSSDPNRPSSNSTLSDQLKPLSQTILPSTPPSPSLTSKPISTWANPTKPKPTSLSLQRHRRSPYSHNPHLKDLKLFSHKLNDPDLSPQDFTSTLHSLPHPPTRENALLILNSLRPWPKTLLFLDWIKTQNLFPLETIFYNVAMKSLRHGKQYQLVEDLANEMAQQGIELDNITYSTIITCAKRCGLFDKAIEWFEKMYRTGLVPDEVTYSTVLDVYARMGKVEEVLSLYERGRAGGWKPDPVAFAVLGRMFGEAADYDGIQYVLQEMKAVGVEPNLVVYNTLLEAMGKAGKPGLARSLFEEMVVAGVTPNEKTLTALVKIYGKARWGRDALQLWEQMRLKRWPMDFILYNTLLSMCADLGLEEEAEQLFEDMKGSKQCRPDSWSYTAMLNIYGSGGKVDEAMRLFEEMAESGVKLNVMGCTCLIQCLGRARQIDDVVRVFGISMERGVEPDDRLCGCLLSVVTFCEDSEVGKVLNCLERANPRLVEFVKMLGREEVGFNEIKEEFRGLLNDAAVEARRPFCNCLIDICRNQNRPERAHELLYLGTLYGLYPGLHNKNVNEWALNVRSLSVGAAHTAFQEWMRSLSKAVERKEELPKLFSVHAGAGTHKFSQGLASAVASHLKKVAAPFRQDEERPGSFFAAQEDLISWVQSGGASASMTA
ncbi:pentatricopeptide repeat-containing protein At5g46580, chloroplastic [Magnolia sinica]|uniref:pentatricopeptide repeat-containing protein At5g46580, chloroplastic n=1 Tax=Magnolia sinica TaxID=86752 RepID=UPI0026596B7B|nr:pentatricopeptide repeat-containing protein At5g46580, chloroplastic [Magnolia sinica]